MKFLLLSAAGMPSLDLLAIVQQQNQVSGIPFWVWLIVLFLVVVIVAIIVTLREEDEAGQTDAASEPEPVTPDLAARPDNLKQIKGIGPKIEKLLKDNGISTFAQLAETEVNRLVTLLEQAEWAIVDPATWPEQAQELAKKGG